MYINTSLKQPVKILDWLSDCGKSETLHSQPNSCLQSVLYAIIGVLSYSLEFRLIVCCICYSYYRFATVSSSV